MAEYYCDIECYKKGEDGFYRPIRDTNYAVLGIVRRKGNKKAFRFDLEKEPESMFNFILQQIEKQGKEGHTATFYFFNTNYDWTAVARNHYYDNNLTYICYKPFICEIKVGAYKGTIRDAMDIFTHMSLKKVGELIDLQKLKMPEKVAFLSELETYCERDVVILEKAIEKIKYSLKELFDYVPKKLVSVNKLGFDLLALHMKKRGTHHLLFHLSQTERNGKQVLRETTYETRFGEILKLACRGGRVEAYKWSSPSIPKKFTDGWKLDCNSMYPFVCSKYDFPDIRYEEHLLENMCQINVLNEKEIQDFFSYMGASEITVEAPDSYIPYLPIRYRRTTLYPNKAILRSVWTNFEILEAVKNGYRVLEIHQSIRYPKLQTNYFREYFEMLYEVKRGKEGALSNIAKILMNSCTGKFAQRLKNQDQRVILSEELPHWLRLGYRVISDLEDGHVAIRKEEEYPQLSSKAHPIIYAHITAYARHELYMHMKKIPEEDLLYVSTDAIVFKGKENLGKFNISDKLGDWKIESSGDVEIWAEQYYMIGESLRTSGLKRTDIDIELIRQGKTMTTPRLFTIKKAFNTGNFDKVGQFDDVPIRLLYTPKRARKYPKYITEETEEMIRLDIVDKSTNVPSREHEQKSSIYIAHHTEE